MSRSSSYDILCCLNHHRARALAQKHMALCRLAITARSWCDPFYSTLVNCEGVWCSTLTAHVISFHIERGERGFLPNTNTAKASSCWTLQKSFHSCFKFSSLDKTNRVIRRTHPTWSSYELIHCTRVVTVPLVPPKIRRLSKTMTVPHRFTHIWLHANGLQYV